MILATQIEQVDMADSEVTVLVPPVKTGSRDSIEPKITIAIVARTNIETDKAAFIWFSTPFAS